MPVLILAPVPGGQMGFEIAVGEVVLRPGQEAVEGHAIIGDHGEEHSIGLSLRG